LIGEEAVPTRGDSKGARLAQRADGVPPAQPAAAAQIFCRGRLNDLAQSVKEKGILQPILVRRSPAIPTPSRSWRASGAGARPSSPSCMKCR